MKMAFKLLKYQTMQYKTIASIVSNSRISIVGSITVSVKTSLIRNYQSHTYRIVLFGYCHHFKRLKTVERSNKHISGHNNLYLKKDNSFETNDL